MTLKKTTVMVDEEHLEIIKEAATREGRPESEYFREAFQIAALRAQRWSGQWDIPELALGDRVDAEDVHSAAEEAVTRKYRRAGDAA